MIITRTRLRNVSIFCPFFLYPCLFCLCPSFWKDPCAAWILSSSFVWQWRLWFSYSAPLPPSCEFSLGSLVLRWSTQNSIVFVKICWINFRFVDCLFTLLYSSSSGLSFSSNSLSCFFSSSYKASISSYSFYKINNG